MNYNAKQVLQVHNLAKHFDKLYIIKNLSFSVMPGELVVISGGNGSGKTTLLNILSGHIKPSNGIVMFCGKQLNGLPPVVVARHGVGRTFQDVHMFYTLTLGEHLKVAEFRSLRSRSGLNGGLRHSAVTRSYLNEFCTLSGVDMNTPVRELSYGQQRVIMLLSVLKLQPSLLLLDEPLTGLSNDMKAFVCDLLLALMKLGLGMVVAEHDPLFIEEIADKKIVL